MLLFNLILIVSLFQPTYPAQEIWKDREAYYMKVPTDEIEWDIEIEDLEDKKEE